MGIDCPDVRQVIHWGVPEDVETYLQESGRAGRDGELSCALMVYGKGDLRSKYISKHMAKYCENSTTCRWELLFQDFADCQIDSQSKGCLCCDICRKNCTCGMCEELLRRVFFSIRYMYVESFFIVHSQ